MRFWVETKHQTDDEDDQTKERAQHDNYTHVARPYTFTGCCSPGLHARRTPRPQIMGSIRPDHDSGFVTASPFVGKLAEEMVGRADPLAAQWLIRVTLALWYWPVTDRNTEYELVQRFVVPPLVQD
jgi:hypothetical protein